MRRAIPSTNSFWPTASWLMLVFTILVGGFAVGTQLLSRALLLDTLSLWPVGLLGLAALPFTLNYRRRGRIRALTPLLWLSWLVLAVGMHLSGWGPLPSSAAELNGPIWSTGQEVSLSLTTDAKLVVSANERGENLYRVGFIRRGGSAGIPQAVERVLELPEGSTPVNPEEIIIGEQPQVDQFMRFEGWDLFLHPQGRWTLELDSGVGEMDASFGGLRISSARLQGQGKLRLGEPLLATSDIFLDGEFEVEISELAPASVSGLAVIPDNWTRQPGGGSSPVSGTGWNIQLEPGAIVSITEVDA